MTVENISWSISKKECCRPRRGLNPQSLRLQSDGASNWATEACLTTLGLYMCWAIDTLGNHFADRTHITAVLLFTVPKRHFAAVPFHIPLHDSGAILWLTLRCPSVRTLFQDNSSHSLNQISLKLVRHLDHEVVQHILFWGYGSSNCDRLLVDTLFNNFSDLTLFSDNFSNSFNPIMLKHGGQLDYEPMQRMLLRGYSTHDRVIAL